MKKIFLIHDDLMGFFPKRKEKYNIFLICDKSKLKHYFRRLLQLFGISPYLFLFNKKWIRRLKKVDEIIIFDGERVIDLVNAIQKKYPHKKIVVWYWNPVKKAVVKPEELIGKVNSIWTYDPFDAKKYNLKLNTQFYFKEELEVSANEYSKLERRYDVFFIGADKGRENELKKYASIFKQQNISYYLHLTKYGYSDKESDTYKSPINYPTVIKYVRNCKAILELKNDSVQEGLSLRPLEALFFKKKLLTNNQSIINSKVYDPKNIFILGVDDIKQLPIFLDGDYSISQNYDSLVKYYSFNSWAKRFEE
mgnify:CR=1 FL=1